MFKWVLVPYYSLYLRPYLVKEDDQFMLLSLIIRVSRRVTFINFLALDFHLAPKMPPNSSCFPQYFLPSYLNLIPPVPNPTCP